MRSTCLFCWGYSCVRKRWSWFCKTIASFVTATRPTNRPRILFSVASNPGASASHMNLKEVVEDVHFRRGISCAGCHGGDPTADLGHAHVKEWPEKDRQKNRAWVVQFCARCHSDPAMMHEFNQALPTDQLAKFKESPHGHRLLDLHDDRAPSCVSCHGVHGIRPAKDPQSKVYAQRVPETCGTCHSNPTIMAGITRADGSPLPTTQLAEYRTSVHGQACSTAAISARHDATPATATIRRRRQGLPASAGVAASVIQPMPACSTAASINRRSISINGPNAVNVTAITRL